MRQHHILLQYAEGIRWRDFAGLQLGIEKCAGGPVGKRHDLPVDDDPLDLP
jgi:hypothetical protein